MTHHLSTIRMGAVALLLSSTAAMAQQTLHGNTPLEGLSTTERAAGGFDRLFPLGNGTIMAVDSDGRPILSPHTGRVRTASTYIIPQSSTVSGLRALGSQVPHDCDPGMGSAAESLVDPKPATPPGAFCGQPGDSRIPAGFTFLGQFVDHDITLDVITGFDSPANVGAVGNARTPNLDLDCIYGDGPEASPFLFEDGVRLRVGASLGEGRHDLVRTNTAISVDPHTGEETVTHGAGANTAIIGDPRNDENLVVSQLQAGFIAVHNAFVEHLVREHWEEKVQGADTLMALFAQAVLGPDETSFIAAARSPGLAAEVAAAPTAARSAAPMAAMGPGKCSPERLGSTIAASDARILVSEDIEDTFAEIRKFCEDPHAEITLLSGAEKREIFEEARAHTIHYYHRALLEDFLPHVIGEDVVKRLRANGRRFFLREGLFDRGEGLRQPNMPVEFSVAGYRYGHSQVRNFYELREGKVVPLFDLPKADGSVPPSMLGFHPLSSDDLIDWTLFFGKGDGSYDGNCARALDHQLAEVLFRLPFAGGAGGRCEIPGAESSLAARNLNRGRVYRLPSGESILNALNTPHTLGYDGAAEFAGLDLDDAVNARFASDGDTPLWLYILLEARSYPVGTGETGLPVGDDGGDGGQMLGPVGGMIVGETILGLMDYFREQTGEGLDFIPGVDIGADDPSRVTVLDLLRFAGQVGE